MNKFFKVSMILLLIVGIVFVLLLQINPLIRYERRYELHRERSQEELKKIEDNFNVFKTTGSCVECDFGYRLQADEKKDLRQVVQLVRGKGLSINLPQAFLINVNLAGADLSGANLSDADLADSDLTGANLTGANLSGADLDSVNLTDANLTGVNLIGANLYHADLQKANLTGANLHKADLRWSKLDGVNLTGANLTSATFVRTHLDGTILTGANLSGALIYLTDLTQVADFTGANLDISFVRSLRAFSYWLNFVCSTIPSGIKSIAQFIKLNFLYYKHWFLQKAKGGTPLTRDEWFRMQGSY